MNNLKPINLVGEFTQLEPVNNSHRDALRLLAQDESIWTYFPSSAAGDAFEQWFEKILLAMENGEQLTFVVRRLSDQKIVGSTRFYEITPKHQRLKIGHTWYTQEARGTAVNPECKLLLLTHAFESLHFNRVEFMTDTRNLNSRAAIKKLGATEEGILRQHMILENGYVRDTVLFSIIKAEWPKIKQQLQSRLLQFADH